MRFLKDGLDIPDELLLARDEGRVIIFAGAGVSVANAKLPDFLSLAERVIRNLGALESSPARKLITFARDTTPIEGIGGLIPADKIFGLLEREFEREKIQKAVASALRPDGVPNLDAHRAIIDLARGIDGKPRIVTTNFDLLFEACDPRLPSFAPPKLPDPRRYNDLHGITHLHGAVDASYSGASQDGFVLSSSEFGSAYLSEAWATFFVRNIIEKYVVLFVGYSADDPPMQYLLEALSKTPISQHGIYAFHAGSDTEAQALWRHKGVQPISYELSGGHQNLWDSLHEWTRRAVAPEAWVESRIALANDGPENLLPHERGQIAHVLSTQDGARRFASVDKPPPAEWLCVFDPVVRYGRPGTLADMMDDGPYIDPFFDYCLDADAVPRTIPRDEFFEKREVPPGALDILAANRLDRINLPNGSFSAVRGQWAKSAPLLPPRLQYIGSWIAKVADQPAAIWWIAGQKGIHPDIQQQIKFHLQKREHKLSTPLFEAWQYIFETWTFAPEYRETDFDLLRWISEYGWTPNALRRYINLQRPHLTIERPFAPKPPSQDKLALRRLISADVKYPKLNGRFDVPDEIVADLVHALRRNIELGIALENEIGGYGLDNLPPFNPDHSVQGTEFNTTHGIALPVFQFIPLIKRLVALDVRLARQEYLEWQHRDFSIFARLRIWASSEARLTSPEEAATILRQLPDAVFWGMRHQRDLLLSVKERWQAFSEQDKERLECRLLRGPILDRKENREERRKTRALYSLNSIGWLHLQGCTFSKASERRYRRLKEDIADWNEIDAKTAADSTEARSGAVTQDTAFEPLATVPLNQILATAAELSRHEHFGMVEKRPFNGLAASRPLVALAALRMEGKKDQYPAWAWSAFLYSDARKDDKPRLTGLIAESIAAFPSLVIAELIHPITSWFERRAQSLSAAYPAARQHIWQRMINCLNEQEDTGKSAVVRRNADEIEWGTEALNSPSGRLADALLDEDSFKNASNVIEYPKEWLRHAEDLLQLPDDAGRHALVMFSFHLKRLYWIDPKWTEANLLVKLNGTERDIDAFWSGYFWSATVPQPVLYGRLKPAMLALAANTPSFKRNDFVALAGILLAGWGTKVDGSRFVTDEELRTTIIKGSDEFRSNVLGELERFSDDVTWKNLRLEFLKDVWPQQKLVKSPSISARFVELICNSSDDFSRVLQAALPHLSKLEREYSALYQLRHPENEEGQSLAQRFPADALVLLWTVLPENVSDWPYGAGECLELIATADKDLQVDDRLIELRRRWNSR